MAAPVVIDCDPGMDDAMALLIAIRAAKEGLWDLKAITIVAGNSSVDNGCTNALRVLQVTNFKADVHRGCSVPMVYPPEESPTDPTPFHGHDGFGDVDYPQPMNDKCFKRDVHAVDRLIELAQKHQGDLVIIALGPLTNIAMAMRKDENFAGKLKELHVMGGNSQGVGNTSSCTEFNTWRDPEAAYVVFNTVECPLFLAPWELCFFHAIQPLQWRKDILGTIDSAEAKLMNSIEYRHVYSSHPIRDIMQKSGYILCDQISVAVALKPLIVAKVKRCYASVELRGRDTRGQTVIDHLRTKKKPDNVTIIEKLNIPEFLRIIKWALYCPNTIISH